MIAQLGLIALGGAAGATLRALVSLLGTSLGAALWATWLVNVLGSFAIGLLWGLAAEAAWFQHWGRALLVVGLLGGFTTFSAFSLETLQLLGSGRWPVALGYAVATVAACVAAAALGQRLAA